MTDQQSGDLFQYALRLGDDALVLGQRLSAWCGHAPILEVDLALANMALDLVGQATHFLEYAGQVEGKGRDGDRLAFHRDVFDFTNCLLVEQPNGDFARTMARQFLFSTWQHALFERLAGSSDATVSAVAQKAVKETAYHVRFASEWMVRLGDGTEESRARLVDGLQWVWRFAEELFVNDEVDERLIASGVAVDKAALRPAWDAHVDRTLAEATVERPAPHRALIGGRVGRHSEHLGHLLSDMQFMQRAYPDARW